MALFDFLRRQTLAGRAEDEALYLAVVQELASGIKRDGLWAQAFAEANGHPDSTKAKYLKLRVQALRDELAGASRLIEEASRQEAIDHPTEDDYDVKATGPFTHDIAERTARFEVARSDLRAKGFMVFRNSDKGWDVWSKDAGVPKDHCATLGALRRLNASK